MPVFSSLVKYDVGTEHVLVGFYCLDQVIPFSSVSPFLSFP